MGRFLSKIDKFAQIQFMKNTALTSTHIALNAKMVPFAGYNMPVSYEGVNAEHETVRKGVGVFDVSHMGEFLITGENALELIQKVTTNDASTLVDGKAQYSCMPNNEGGIVDDLIIYRFNAEKYLLVVNASNIESFLFSAMPIPVSSKTNLTVTVSFLRSTTSRPILTNPFSVNLMALATKLLMIWPRRTGSPNTCLGK